MRFEPGGGRAYADSTGKLIKTGDVVRFRGQEFTIKAFGPVEEHYGVATLIFEEEVTHTPETPHECNIDLVRES